MRFKVSQLLVALLIVGTLMLGSCSTQQASSNSSPASTTTDTTTATTEATSVSQTISESIPGMKDLPRLEGKAKVVMTVNGSPITIEVDGTNAPITAGNFVDLVNKGVYDGLKFHRVVRSPQPFVVQGGDPKSKQPNSPTNQVGTGGYIDPKTGTERYIPLEIKPETKPGDKELPIIYGKTFQSAGVTNPPVLRHTLGAVAMARSQQPDSASSQFYFALADLAFLDGNYAVFGYVTDGFDVVNKIQEGDIIQSAKVTEGIGNLKNSQ